MPPMLSKRGWWLFVVILALLGLGVVAEASTVTLLALTLLLWFLWHWLVFAIGVRRLPKLVSIDRQLADERGSVQTLWARLPAKVHVALHLRGRLSLPFVSMIDRLPALARIRQGDSFADGPLTGAKCLQTSYVIECPAPGRLRFEGVKLRVADLHGFFAHQTFVRSVNMYRVLPPLADARGHIPALKRHNLIPLMGNHPFRRPGSGSELLDLRDYLPGDPPKMIAWKASARRDRLMTKEFESEVPVRCTLFVDCSNSVRVGAVGQNAVARLIEIASAVTQASAAARDLTGLCLFEEDGVRSLVRPARGAPHLLRLTNSLADAADLQPQADKVPLARLLPLAFGALQDLYPEFLELEINSWPIWLPFWSPQPWYTMPPRRWAAHSKWATPFVQLARVFLARLHPRALFGNFFGLFSPHAYRWRKQVAAVLSVRYHLGPGGLALLLEDDAHCSRLIQRFLADHQIPCPLPFYDARGVYLFKSPAKIGVLARALMHAVLRAHDNELFVLLVDLLEIGSDLETVLRAVRVALGRHHQVIVVCPWPPGVALPQGHSRSDEDSTPDLQRFLSRANTLRFHQAFAQVKRAFAKLGVTVLCAPDDQAIGIILERMQRLRKLERGLR